MESQPQKNAWTWLQCAWKWLRESVANLWDWVVDGAVVFWIARVSVASVAIGLILFAFIPQVRDTFLEIRGTSTFSPSNLKFWSLFFLSLVLFWALPVTRRGGTSSMTRCSPLCLPV